MLNHTLEIFKFGWLHLLAFFVFLAEIEVNFAFNTQIKFTEKDKKTIVLSIFKRTNFEDSRYSESIYISKNNIPNSIFDEFTEVDGKKIVYLSDDEIEEKTKYGFTYWEFIKFEVKRDKVSVNFVQLFQNSEFGISNSFGIGWDYKKSKGKWEGKIQRFIINRT